MTQSAIPTRIRSLHAREASQGVYRPRRSVERDRKQLDAIHERIQRERVVSRREIVNSNIAAVTLPSPGHE
jgi:hypothetical protein